MVRRLVGSVLGVALAACVSDTTVIGDDRSRAACAEAILLEAPASGCSTPEVIESRSPHGCVRRASDGTVIDEFNGSWVRLHRSPERAALVRVRDLDAVPGGAGSSLLLAGPGAAPCSCRAETLDAFSIGTEVFEWPLTYVDHELLFTTPRRFEVQICTVDGDPYPRCSGGLGDAGNACPGLPYARSGAHCACLPPCGSSAECPVGATGSASPECTETGCELRCSDTARCPDGQECIAGRHGGLCMWPG